MSTGHLQTRQVTFGRVDPIGNLIVAFGGLLPTPPLFFKGQTAIFMVFYIF